MTENHPKRLRTIYISGPYRGDVEKNVRRARNYAIRLWEQGWGVLCPHLNTAFFDDDCLCTPEIYLERDLWLLEGCDAMFMIPGWEHSKGARDERRYMQEVNRPVFVTLKQTKEALRGGLK